MKTTKETILFFRIVHKYDKKKEVSKNELKDN